ncbi:MAG: hypothetical protein KF779_15700 [Hyphomonadaceae bacterium]|nr:hypothetical protein [Hyphomonadaceae bacterium]
MSLRKISEWQQDAEEEQGVAFYLRPDVPELLTGERSLVIGRKGAGKTAVFKYLARASKENGYLFQAYEADSLDYEKAGKISDNLAQITAFWKDIIYSSALELLRQEYDKSAPPSAFSKAAGFLSQMVNFVLEQDFEIEVKGVKIARQRGEDWQRRSDAARAAITDIGRALGKATKVMVVFDRLDQGMRTTKDTDPESPFAQTILGLVRACFEIRRENRGQTVELLPVVLIRTDIYDLLRDPDKNRWSPDRAVNLKWTNTEIKALLEHRIAVAMDREPASFPVGWRLAFEDERIRDKYDNKEEKTLFDFIDLRTAWRPRDYVYFIREAARYAVSAGEKRIDQFRVTSTEYNYSTYLRQELIDEGTASMPDLPNVFTQLTQLVEDHPTRRFFDSAAFEQYFGVSGSELSERLNRLYTMNIIGNSPPREGQRRAKDARYSYNSDMFRAFNPRQDIVLHPGVHRFLRA